MKILNEIKFTVPADSRNEGLSRVVVSAFAAQLDPSVSEVGEIKTAVSEAVTNCIVHAYQGKQQGLIYVDCALDDEGYITVDIKDCGKGIPDVKQAMRPFYTTGTEGERSGMGFTVMQAFCDKVDVKSSAGETVVTLIKKV